MMLKQREIHEDLASSLPSQTVAEWKNVSLEPVQGEDKKWTSPLADPLLSSTYTLTILLYLAHSHFISLF